MNLSASNEYRSAIDAATSNNAELAREQFSRLIALARAESDTESLGFLLHNLGAAEARAGNHEVAHELYREAASLDPESPQPSVFYAESLLHAFRQPSLVESVLREAESRLAAPAWALLPQELPRAYYEAEFSRIRREVQREAP